MSLKNAKKSRSLNANQAIPLVFNSVPNDGTLCVKSEVKRFFQEYSATAPFL